MLNKVLWVIVGVPLAVVLVIFSVANRHLVELRLDPFNAENPAFSTSLPLFVFLFVTLLAGILIGGVSVWLTQGKYRRQARTEKSRADNLIREAEKGRKSLSAPDRHNQAA